MEPFGKFVKIISGDYFEYDQFTESEIPILKIDNVIYGKVDWGTTTYLPYPMGIKQLVT